MSPLRLNLIANYFGQAYGAIVGLVFMPICLRYLGAEAFGLIGFFTMMQAWFYFLDLGLTPTLSRELARFRAGALSQALAGSLVRTLEWVFIGLGGCSALLLILAANRIASEWLKTEHLDRSDVTVCVSLMGCIIGLRGVAGLYRGGLAGLERMVSLNAANMAIVSCRSIGVIAILDFSADAPRRFFTYQIFVAFAELLVTGVLFYRAFPMRHTGVWPDLRLLRGRFAFAGSMAFLSAIWIIITQADKLILSWVLNLRAFGQFSAAVALAGGITMIAAPLSAALQPRLTFLAMQGARDDLVRIYRLSTQLMAIGMTSVAGVMVCFAKPILCAWTGDPLLASAAARVLPLYATGNAVSAMLALAFQAQFAYGKTRWHVIGNAVFTILWLPGVYVGANLAGAVGAGWIWLIGNLAFLVLWLPFVHGRILPELRWSWLFGDILAVVFPVGLALYITTWMPFPENRLAILFTVGMVSVLAASLGVLIGSRSRELVFGLIRHFASGQKLTKV